MNLSHASEPDRLGDLHVAFDLIRSRTELQDAFAVHVHSKPDHFTQNQHDGERNNVIWYEVNHIHSSVRPHLISTTYIHATEGQHSLHS